MRIYSPSLSPPPPPSGPFIPDVRPLAEGRTSLLKSGVAWMLLREASEVANQHMHRTGDQLCGVGLSVRFNSHLITIWHRDSSKQASIDGMLACVMEELPAELRPKSDNYFYKRHRDHAGFKAPPDAQPPAPAAPGTTAAPEVTVEPPSAH